MSEVKRLRLVDKNGYPAMPIDDRVVGERWVSEQDYDAVQAELATANGCLEEWRRSKLGQIILENMDLRNRLSAAEQRNVTQRGLLHRALNVIRGMRYDELEASIVEALNIPTESGASE